MRIGRTRHAVTRWSRHLADRWAAPARVPSIDQQLMEIAQRARAAGVPYETWRRVIHRQQSPGF